MKPRVFFEVLFLSTPPQSQHRTQILRLNLLWHNATAFV